MRAKLYWSLENKCVFAKMVVMGLENGWKPCIVIASNYKKEWHGQCMLVIQFFDVQFQDQWLLWDVSLENLKNKQPSDVWLQNKWFLWTLIKKPTAQVMFGSRTNDSYEPILLSNSETNSTVSVVQFSYWMVVIECMITCLWCTLWVLPVEFF